MHRGYGRKGSGMRRKSRAGLSTARRLRLVCTDWEVAAFQRAKMQCADFNTT